MPSPAEVVQTARRRRLNVAWYGGGRRDIEVVSPTGHWRRAGEGLVAVRWVFVHDRTGTHRDEFFFTTEVGLSPQAVVEAFTGRWSIETTFQELRAYVGLETTRGRTANTVLRMAPCLFGLFTVIALLYAELPACYARVGAVSWVGKQQVTYSDAITAVRRWLWQEWVFANPSPSEAFAKLSRPLRAILLYAVAPAA